MTDSTLLLKRGFASAWLVVTATSLSGCLGDHSSSGTASSHSLGGSISGLSTSGLVLVNGTDTLTIDAGATQFLMAQAVASGTSYDLTVQTQPTGMNCTVSDGSGKMGSSDVSSIAITCSSLGPLVSTLAGSGTAGAADGVGTAASFNHPAGVAMDSSGNLYVADYQGNKIRKIATDGTVTTLAGSGTEGWSDGVGTNAEFGLPMGVAVDASGNVYVAEYGHNKVRKITADGTVTTLAGSGNAGSVDGVGTAASFAGPGGIAVDSEGNVYVSEYVGQRIRKITADGTVTTLAGNGATGSTDGAGAAATFSYPMGMALSSDGSLYVADSVSNKIRKVTLDGTVTTLAGSGGLGSSDGGALTATFHNPRGVATDSSGNVYVTDADGNLVRKISSDGTVSTYAGSGNSGATNGYGTSASFAFPWGLTSSSDGTLYVGDCDGNSIRKLTVGAP